MALGKNYRPVHEYAQNDFLGLRMELEKNTHQTDRARGLFGLKSMRIWAVRQKSIYGDEELKRAATIIDTPFPDISKRHQQSLSSRSGNQRHSSEGRNQYEQQQQPSPTTNPRLLGEMSSSNRGERLTPSHLLTPSRSTQKQKGESRRDQLISRRAMSVPALGSSPQGPMPFSGSSPSGSSTRNLFSFRQKEEKRLWIPRPTSLYEHEEVKKAAKILDLPHPDVRERQQSSLSPSGNQSHLPKGRNQHEKQKPSLVTNPAVINKNDTKKQDETMVSSHLLTPSRSSHKQKREARRDQLRSSRANSVPALGATPQTSNHPSSSSSRSQRRSSLVLIQQEQQQEPFLVTTPTLQTENDSSNQGTRLAPSHPPTHLRSSHTQKREPRKDHSPSRSYRRSSLGRNQQEKQQKCSPEMTPTVQGENRSNDQDAKLVSSHLPTPSRSNHTGKGESRRDRASPVGNNPQSSDQTSLSTSGGQRRSSLGHNQHEQQQPSPVTIPTGLIENDPNYHDEAMLAPPHLVTASHSSRKPRRESRRDKLSSCRSSSVPALGTAPQASNLFPHSSSTKHARFGRRSSDCGGLGQLPVLKSILKEAKYSGNHQPRRKVQFQDGGLSNDTAAKPLTEQYDSYGNIQPTTTQHLDFYAPVSNHDQPTNDSNHDAYISDESGYHDDDDDDDNYLSDDSEFSEFR